MTFLVRGLKTSENCEHCVDPAQQPTTSSRPRAQEGRSSSWSWRRLISMTYYACTDNAAKWSAVYHDERE
jgi:hypothetical protein